MSPVLRRVCRRVGEGASQCLRALPAVRGDHEHAFLRGWHPSGDGVQGCDDASRGWLLGPLKVDRGDVEEDLGW